MKLAEFKEKYIGDRAFYKRYLYLALPMICLLYTSAEEDLEEPLKDSIKKRMPWLIVLLGLGLVVSSVVGMFEHVVEMCIRDRLQYRRSRLFRELPVHWVIRCR